jgi:fructokinase
VGALRLGIDLGGTKIEGVALDGSREHARIRRDTPRDDYRGTLDAIASMVETLEQDAGSRGTVGVGIPGTISADGLVKNANSVWLLGRPLETDLRERLGRDVRIANDANCFAASESADGAAAGAGVVFAVIVGTGTGAGIAVNGRVLTGPNGIAGEWGHNPLPWATDDERPGPACYCGQQGCIETFLSGPGLSADYERCAGERREPREIASRAAAGDAAADAALRRYESRMARALAAIVNVLDPDVIVLGGGMSNVGRLYANVPRLWGEFVFACGARRGGSGQSGSRPIPAEPVRTRLVPARHGAASGVRGAAWLWGESEA